MFFWERDWTELYIVLKMHAECTTDDENAPCLDYTLNGCNLLYVG